MKRLLIITILCIAIPCSAHAAVRITEIAWMGIEGENGQFGEWVELYNDDTEAVNLSGWKLYSGGGSDLIFSLTKSIAPNNYLLIERKTASMSDAVPGVTDESGTFGGGGLSNTGEFLVLKDASGATIQSLNFASGWPAGDGTTKETMQWNGSAWITASPTPKTGTTGISHQNDAEDSGTPDDAAIEQPPVKARTKKVVHTEPYVTIHAPKQAYLHIQYPFSAEVGLKNGAKNPSRGIYKWNFGDGSTAVQTDKINPMVHTYEYPGTYTVWFGYYETVFSLEPLILSTAIVTVGKPELTTTILDGSAIKIVNETDDIVDLSNWILHSGSAQAVIPPMTILSSGGTIVIPVSKIGMTLGKSVSLAAPDNYAFVFEETVARATTSPMAYERIPEVKGESIVAQETTDDTIAVMEEPVSTNNRTKEILFGAVVVTIIGLFLLLERTMARQE